MLPLLLFLKPGLRNLDEGLLQQKNRDYGTGEVDVCYIRSGFYDKEIKEYVDFNYALDLKSGDIYDDWTTSDSGYYMRIHYFLAEDYTPTVKTSDVHIKNNKMGKKDTISITNLKKMTL